MAALLGSCFARWAHVEAQEAILFGVLLDAANTKASTAAFTCVHSAAVQRDMINAAANAKHSKEDASLIQALLDAMRPLAKERDHLAHGLWYVCDDIPDGLVWLEDKDLATFGVRDFDGIQKGQERIDIQQGLTEKLFMYDENDLAQLEERFAEMRLLIVDLMFYLVGNPRPLRPLVTYDRLCAAPPIREALNRRRGSSKTHP